MAQGEAADSERKNLAERALSALADVRAGEGAGVLLLGLGVFLLLVSYYLLKTVREPLILTQGGAEVKTYSAAGQALLLLAIVPAYGAFASRVSRIRLITWVTLIFVFNLLLFYAFGVAGAREGVVFFLWVGTSGDLRHDLHASQPDSASAGQNHMVQEVLRERTSKLLAYIATLLGLVLPPQSVRLALRALRTEDAKLRGVALEYLDSVLPHSLREQLSARMEGPAPARSTMRPEEALANLLESSPSIVARLEEMGFDAPDQ